MKTSYSWYVFFFVLGGIAMVAAQNMLFVKAAAQPPADETRAVNPAAPNIRGAASFAEPEADATTIESRVPTVALEQLPDGTYIQRPVFTPDGGTVLFGGGPAGDPETAKLLQEELQATQEAQKLWSDFRAAESDGDKEKVKTQLREKLTTIFDLQQKRRAGEVAKIEQRLAKLKATMSKRDAAKQEIVDRRLDVLTGGIDELGWEDTFRGPGAQRFEPIPAARYETPSSPIHSPGPAVFPPSRNPYMPQPTDSPATTLPPPTNTPATPVPNRAVPALPAAPADAALEEDRAAAGDLDVPALPAAPADAAPPTVPRTTTGR